MDGKQIAQERQRRGWTQPELARRMDTTVRSVSRWETGAVVVPDDAARRLAAIFAAADPAISDSERLASLERKIDALQAQMAALLARG